jgi:hypothetical protein
MSEIQEFLAQLEMLKSVWQPFAMGLFVLSTCIFFAIDWRYKGVVDAKSATVEQLTAAVGEYKSKLSGASPDEARAKIERLEQTLRLAIGSRWETLTADQSNRLFNAISAMQTRRIQIMFENPFGKELATSIADVFRRFLIFRTGRISPPLAGAGPRPAGERWRRIAPSGLRLRPDNRPLARQIARPRARAWRCPPSPPRSPANAKTPAYRRL